MSENKTGDIFGIAPYGQALNTAVEKSFEVVKGFLKSVCLPASDEVGLMLKDQVRFWRLNNVLKIIEKSKGKLEFKEDEVRIKAHPRVALSIIEYGSVIDNEEVQELWAGLFASSCTKDGQDDENLIFVDILRQLTAIEVKILNYSCEISKKIIVENGLISSGDVYISFLELTSLIGITDKHRIDRELDHLRSLQLIDGGFNIDSKDLNADISPTPLALNLYVRAQGSSKTPVEFWMDSIMTRDEYDKQKQLEALKKREQAKSEQNKP